MILAYRFDIVSRVLHKVEGLVVVTKVNRIYTPPSTGTGLEIKTPPTPLRVCPLFGYAGFI